MRTVSHLLVPLLAVVLISSLPAACASGRESGEAAPGGQPAPAPARGYVTDIERATLENEDYRRVLVTGAHTQLVLMTLRPGEEIGQETHEDGDQFIRVEAGTGRVVMNGQAHPVEDGSAVVIPAGVAHNVVNTGDAPLRLYVLYSPPEHAPGTVHRTKQEAEAAKRGH